MKKWLLSLFILASLAELAGILLNLPFRVISKPLLMILLLGYYMANDPKPSKIFIAALVFAWFGDVFLLGSAEWSFIAGLLSFLMMQFCYCYVFYKQTAIWRMKDTAFAMIMLLYVCCFMYYLWPSLGELKIPVSVYGCSFGTVTMMAYWRHKNFEGWNLVLAGILLFVLSDSIIAVNRFKAPIVMADFWIMLSYIVGQYLIVEGYIRSIKNKF